MRWHPLAIHLLELLLILAIIGLLIATWLPVWIGGQPGLSQWQ